MSNNFYSFDDFFDTFFSSCGKGKITLDDKKEKETEATQGVKKSAPWVSYVALLKMLFENDPDVRIIYRDETPYIVDINITGEEKFEAATKLIGETKTFGNVVLTIRYHLSNPVKEEKSKKELFKALFEGNPILTDVVTVELPDTSNNITYFLFKDEVVQYWDDDLSNPHGMVSTLWEEIMKELFDDTEEVIFTTRVNGKDQ